ncbi:MAG: SPOR domain-containing protein [Candidatus Marinimicrobia bacterium]|nr:SPOR domain-containing protein [Candidatus Neomarinimicrobiota bacterium]
MKLFYFWFFLNFVTAQDSLFWFNTTDVIDSIPDSPKVIDKIFIKSQFKNLDRMKLNTLSDAKGFRLQIYETSSVEEANKKILKFKKALRDSIYMSFEAPFYKVRYGNYSTREQAEIEKKNILSKGYKSVWIVKSNIHLK